MNARNKRTLVGVVIVVGLIAAAAVSLKRVVPESDCGSALTKSVLLKSLKVGTQFIRNHQKPEGNFNYLYDWTNKTFDPGDNQVRQAGALWGLALIFQNGPESETLASIQKALAFFEGHSALTESGARYIRYPGERRGALGTVSLVALAYIDLLRTETDLLSEAVRADYEKRLDEYLAFLVSARHSSGLWHSRFDMETGKPFSKPSPYFDGETLLALAKAARYLGRTDLKPVVLDAAEAGYRLNISAALAMDPDSNTTKGYYQWSSMAFYEIATSGWGDNVDVFGTRLMDLADWMIDVHRTLLRTRNTGYAHEGIIHAFAYAKEKGHPKRAEKFSCVARTGLEKLTSWQLGNPLSNSYIRTNGGGHGDRLAIGGVQNHRSEPGLRIDVAQHQMHAVILALRHMYTP